MSEEKNSPKKKPRRKMTFGKGLKIFILLILILIILGGGLAAGSVISILHDVPEIDPTNINATLDQTSSIYDQNGNLIEKIQAEELRTIISIKDLPQHLLDAFISIEDERFESHFGVDPYGIGAAILDNFKAGGIARGASTITQQLARNLYLNNHVEISRKLKEAYLAMQIEQVLSKSQILEAYLNRSYFGQNAYGIQEAAQTYFSKDAKDLTIAESAMLAGIVKSTVQFQPYYRVKPSDYDASSQYKVGEVDVLGERMTVVYNEASENRQKLVLAKMLELEKINQHEYEQALSQDMRRSLKPFVKQPYDITSYFADYVKTEVVNSLMEKLGYTRQEAEDLLYTGGLSIYATIDLEMQQDLEDIYDNFTEILVGNTENVRGPILIDWTLSNAGNILDRSGKVLYWEKDNLLTEDYSLVLASGTYEITDQGLILDSSKLTPYPAHIEVGSYYIINEKKNLVTHRVGSLTVPEEEFSVDEEGKIHISKAYLDENEDFYRIEDENLLISEDYFYIEKNGIIQPQSATSVLDYRTGHIKALVGGRDVEGNRLLNRATDSARQPGSAMKPLAVYLPALDNGYNAGTGIDDIPFYRPDTGDRWPSNVNLRYNGITSLRRSVERSVNVNAVKTLDDIGIETSKSYLEKMGIIDRENPGNDNFVTREESGTNDEGLAAMALGGMTNGLSPLEVTAAYGAIANEGVYVEPIAFTHIVDKNDNTLLDNVPKETIVVSPQIAYVMKDILRTTVLNGHVSPTLENMVVAGKTGTTQRQADIWFAGFTPYYVSATWIGNDSPALTITRGSEAAAKYWQHINRVIHEDLEPIREFERPEGITTASVCTQSGKLATRECANDPRDVVKEEIFAVGTVPNEYCDMHVAIEVCTVSNKLATEYCPETRTRVLVQRDPPYDPKEHDDIVPSDWDYNAPTDQEYCDVHDEQSWLDRLIDSLFPGNGDDDEDEDDNGNGGPPPSPTPPPADDDDDEDNGNGNGNNNGGNNGGNNGNGPPPTPPGDDDDDEDDNG